MTKTWVRVAVVLFLYLKAPLEAAENLRADSGGFTTAIHGVLWAAYGEKIFHKYGLDVEYLASQYRQIGHANAPLR